MRIGTRLGLFPAAKGNGDEWLRKRGARPARGDVSFERQTPEGGWLHVVERSTRDGGTVILVSDISEAKRRETALTILAGAGQGDADFFKEAVQALAAGLGYRWAGIARLSEGGARLVPLAFCEDKTILPVATFDVAGTGCAEVLARSAFFAVENAAAARHPGYSLLTQ